MPYDDGKPVTKYKRPSELQIFLIKDDQAGMCAISGEFLLMLVTLSVNTPVVLLISLMLIALLLKLKLSVD